MRKIKLISAFVFAAALSLGLTARANDNVKAESPEAVQQGRTVTGTVSDASGAVIGAPVSVKGTANGTVTDSDGRFTLRNVASGSTIVVSFLGYKSQEIKYTGQTSLAVTLEEDAKSLDEVVITGFGIAKEKKKLGFAATTIKSDDLIKAGSTNFGTALYGKAPGVNIVSPPGGAASGVSFNIRGISSINGDTQPLVVLNGVPIRAGNDEGGTMTGQFAQFGAEGKIRSNGLTDINPEEIEELTILKGAAASALYGSEGANGVIVITTKQAKQGQVQIDFSVNMQANQLSYLPKIQSEYGPGHWLASQGAYELETGGFVQINYKGQTYETTKASQGVNHVWGPKYDGRPVLFWDGTVRPYEAQSADPWSELFRDGFDQIYSLAISQGNEASNNRFSYRYTDEIPNGLTGSYKKHDYGLTGNLRLTPSLTLKYSASYYVTKVHNRQSRATGAYDSFSNCFSSFTDIAAMKRMYQTSLGYRNVVTGDATLTPDESFAYNPGPEGWVRNYLWGQYKNNVYEDETRFVGMANPQWAITPWLRLSGRLSADITANKTEAMYATTRPLSLYSGQGEGQYKIYQKMWEQIYGDVFLTFDKNITEKLNITATANANLRSIDMQGIGSWTNGGLTTENAFMLGASRTQVSTDAAKSQELKTAVLGTIDLSYGDFIFLGVTGREEKSSTLPKGSNTYFYPSANLSFLYTSLIKDKVGDWYDYGKLRFNYAKVGNAPAPYAANIVYSLTTSGDFNWVSIPSTLGNEKLKPETTVEYEIGWENSWFKNRAGLEISYYHKTISDMLIPQPLATSDGVGNIWLNVGEMTNSGTEIAITGTPLDTKTFTIDLRANLAFQSNMVNKLVTGQEYLRGSGNMGNHGGGLNIRHYVGSPMGDLYANVPAVVEDKSSEFYGEPIIVFDDDVFAYYQVPPGEQVQQKIGNIMPKTIGGFGADFYYKKNGADFLALSVMTDFRIGGDVLDMSKQYPTARGLSLETMNYRDAAHGGLDYTYKGKTYHNGMIIPGVVAKYNEDGSVYYERNTTVTAADYYYNVTYNWGSGDGVTYKFSTFENTYWKLREVNLSYFFPKSILKHAAMKRLQLSVFGRNLFYFYKTLKDIDAESINGGSTWGGQAGVGYTAAPTRTIGVTLRGSF
jgi:TonB-linked SusC/RagA family outer membrane protein